MNHQFWHHADKLVGSSKVVIMHAKGSLDASGTPCPLDYGFLSEDGVVPSGLECWIGSLEPKVTGALITVDPQKQESVVKLLIGCTKEEGESALAITPGAQIDWR